MKQNVFLSYRSDNGGAAMAGLLKKGLEASYNVSVFMDAINLKGGRFDDQLLKQIRNCDSVVLALARNSLDHCCDEGDWVRIEIEYALKLQKKIVPVFDKDFVVPNKGEVPDSVYEALQYQGVPLEFDLLDASIEKLAKYLGASNRIYHCGKEKRRFVAWLLIILFIVFSTCYFLFIQLNKRSNQRQFGFDGAFNDHLVIEWENANHQYAQGLNSWKRLDYTRAESDMQAALEEMSIQMAQSEVEVAAVSNSLGCLYLDMGKYENAYDYLNSAYVAFEKAYGGDSKEARAVQLSIAQHDYYTGDNATALKMCETILNETDLDKEKTIVTAVKHFKAKILDEQGHWEKALNVYQEVLDLYVDDNGELLKPLTDFVYNAKLGEGEGDYSAYAARWAAITYNARACVYLHMQDYNKARWSLDHGINICSSNDLIGEKDMITADIYRNLALVYGHRGELRRGMDCIDRARRIVWNIFEFKENHPSLIEIYEAYGSQYCLGDDPIQAIEYYNKALDLAIASFGENHPLTAQACNILGLYYYNSENYACAISFFQRAIEIRKNILGVDYVDTVEYYVNLAKAQIGQENWKDAEEYLGRADEICSKLEIEGMLAIEIERLLEEVTNL